MGVKKEVKIKKSKLAITSFVLSLIPIALLIIILILFFLSVFISFSQIERGRNNLPMDSTWILPMSIAVYILLIVAVLFTAAALITAVIRLIKIYKNKKLTGKGLAISALTISIALSVFYLNVLLYILTGISSP